jgi:hypothetical protein
MYYLHTVVHKIKVHRHAKKQCNLLFQKRSLLNLYMSFTGSQSATNAPRLLWVVDMNNPASPQIIHTHSFDENENGRANDMILVPVNWK